MLCDVCKCNDASVFLTQILEGKMQKVNLCDACSKEKGVQDPTGFALADLLLGIGAAEEIEKGAPTQKCPVCGFTQADFKKTGRLGCSACYRTFSEGLGTLLKAMHKGVEHVGKLPERAARQLELSDKMRTLSNNLEKAVAEENYETAAALRLDPDELNALVRTMSFYARLSPGQRQALEREHKAIYERFGRPIRASTVAALVTARRSTEGDDPRTSPQGHAAQLTCD